MYLCENVYLKGDIVTYIVLLQILFLIIFNILLTLLVKIKIARNNFYFVSLIYLSLLITILLKELKVTLFFLGYFITIISFICYTLFVFNFSKYFTNIMEAFDSLSKGQIDFVLKKKFKYELKIYLEIIYINMNFKSLSDNVRNFARELSEKIYKMDEKSRW